MSTKFKVILKTHEIEYRESSNDWFNPDVGEFPSLAAAKKALDEFDRKGRRADIEALLLKEGWRSYDGPSIAIVEAKVGALAEPRWAGDPPSDAWITYGPRKTREKVSLRALFPLEARGQLEEYIRRHEAARKAVEEAEKFRETLQPYTADSIKKVKEQANEGSGIPGDQGKARAKRG